MGAIRNSRRPMAHARDVTDVHGDLPVDPLVLVRVRMEGRKAFLLDLGVI